jgi:hypothetical protein
MEFNSSGSSMANSASRVLAIIGFVALIIIGMYGSVRVAQSVPGAFSKMAAAIVSITSIFVPANETITLSLPTYTVQHDTPVTVAFDHQNKKVNGTYTFRYSCIDGVLVTTIAGDGTTSTIGCNQPYPFAPFNNSVTVTPLSEKTRFADIEIFVGFTPEGTGTATVIGSTVMTIENAKLSTSALTPGGTTETPVVTPTPTPTPAPTPKPTPKPTPPPRTTIVVPQGRMSDPNGYTDLIARIIEVGVIDSTGAFTASSTPNRTSRVAVRFAVENIGTKTAAKEFTFSAVLPTYPPYTYFSPTQIILGPGDRIEYTIGFDAFEVDNTGDFLVNVDPTGSVNEKDKTNNVVKQTITVVK